MIELRIKHKIVGLIRHNISVLPQEVIQFFRVVQFHFFQRLISPDIQMLLARTVIRGIIIQCFGFLLRLSLLDYLAFQRSSIT